MKAFRFAIALALVLVTGRAAAAGTDDPGERSDYATDATGRRMRVTFDPGKRIFFGASHAPERDGSGAVDAERLALETGIAYRHAIDFEDEGVRWKLEHDLFMTRVTLNDGRGALEGELYALRFLRWSADGSIVLPTTPPRRLGFPFGLGFEVAVGRADLELDGGLHGEFGALRGALLLDLVPRRRLGPFVALAVGPRYDVLVDEGGPSPIDHRLVPFSRPELVIRQETSDGHHVFAARGGGGYAWSSVHGAAPEAGARVGYEAVLVAVNDLPLSFAAELRWRWMDEPRPGGTEHEVVGTYGLRLGVPLSRGAY